MKCSEVTKKDVQLASQMVNMLQSGSWDLVGKELCAAADTIRWFQVMATSLAEGFSAGLTSEPPVAPATVSAVPTPVTNPEPEAPKSGLGSGVKIKNYNAGKLGKSR